MSFNTSYVVNQPKNQLIVDGELIVDNAGYRYFGATSGRGDQEIADCSNFNNIDIEITSSGGLSGQVYLVFYDELGKTAGIPYVQIPHKNDEKPVKIIELNAHTNSISQTTIYSHLDFPFLDLNYTGVTVFFPSVPVNTKLQVKIRGGY